MIPDYQKVMLPLLKLLADGRQRNLRDLIAPLAEEFKLSEVERTTLLASGHAPVFRSRINWARAYLKQAGLVESPVRGSVVITARGRQVLVDDPLSLTNEYLNRYSEFREFRSRGRNEPPLPVPMAGTAATTAQEPLATPEEQLEQSWRLLQEQLMDELLTTVKTASASFFEHLVVDLLVKMGYGGSHLDAAQVSGRSGDGGIDGVIEEDKLGLDAIYVQAKRWEGVVGRPVVQAFAGSLEGARARKGVMITTSGFSNDARSYVSQIEKKIVLIDGRKLVRLMVEHDVGVITTNPFPMQKVNSTYFEEE